jgi:hypothetical protein
MRWSGCAAPLVQPPAVLGNCSASCTYSAAILPEFAFAHALRRDMARINTDNTAPFTGRLEAFTGNTGIGEWPPPYADR